MVENVGAFRSVHYVSKFNKQQGAINCLISFLKKNKQSYLHTLLASGFLHFIMHKSKDPISTHSSLYAFGLSGWAFLLLPSFLVCCKLFGLKARKKVYFIFYKAMFMNKWQLLGRTKSKQIVEWFIFNAMWTDRRRSLEKLGWDGKLGSIGRLGCDPDDFQAGNGNSIYFAFVLFSII